MTYAEVDWAGWSPRERATLMLIVTGGRILLIRKKRGLGAGKFNGPGGRIEPGETPLQAIVREVREEIVVTPTGISRAGELAFQFIDGYSLHATVFTASGLVGEPRETDEALPLWFPVDAIPYHGMWSDDRVWMPAALAGRPFTGRFLFDGDQMMGGEMEFPPELDGMPAEG